MAEVLGMVVSMADGATTTYAVIRHEDEESLVGTYLFPVWDGSSEQRITLHPLPIRSTNRKGWPAERVSHNRHLVEELGVNPDNLTLLGWIDRRERANLTESCPHDVRVWVEDFWVSGA